MTETAQATVAGTEAGPDARAASPLADAARAVGLDIAAAASWPASDLDEYPPALPGFIVSSFSPLAAEAAARCLRQRPTTTGVQAESATAVIIASPLGDAQSAVHVAKAIDAGGRVGPLLFFQSVPNAVAGHIAARWRLTGPVASVGDVDSALDMAALLIEDGDADEALLVLVEQAVPENDRDARDRAHAVLLRAAPRHTEGGQP